MLGALPHTDVETQPETGCIANATIITSHNSYATLPVERANWQNLTSISACLCRRPRSEPCGLVEALPAHSVC